MTDHLTIEQRERLKEQLAGLDRAEAAINEAMAPLRKAIDGIDGARNVLLGNREVAGTCEECGKLLLVGERGCRPYSDASEIILCEEHATTWRDIVEQIDKEPEAWEDEESIGRAKMSVAARRGDGTLDEKIIHEL